MSMSVCVSVREHISGTTRPIFTNFLCMLRMISRRRYDMLCISGFVDDVIFAHKLARTDDAEKANS